MNINPTKKIPIGGEKRDCEATRQIGRAWYTGKAEDVEGTRGMLVSEISEGMDETLHTAVKQYVFNGQIGPS